MDARGAARERIRGDNASAALEAEVDVAGGCSDAEAAGGSENRGNAVVDKVSIRCLCVAAGDQKNMLCLIASARLSESQL